MRIVGYALVAVLAILIGLGAGYLFWGVRVTDLTRELQGNRSESEYRLAEMQRRAKAAEDQARREADARKMLEEELHRIRPQK